MNDRGELQSVAAPTGWPGQDTDTLSDRGLHNSRINTRERSRFSRESGSYEPSISPTRIDLNVSLHYTECMPKQLTIRGVPREVALRLESISRARRQSVNATVLQILQDAVGTQQRKQRLEKYATWTYEDLAEFQKILSDQRRIDDDLWR